MGFVARQYRHHVGFNKKARDIIAKLRTLLTLFGVAASAQLAAPLSLAQGYPSRPIKLLVPYGTGGGSDTLARQIGARLQTIWGQGVAIDNRAGVLSH